MTNCNFILTNTCGGIHPWWVERALPRHGDVSWVGSTLRPSVPASLHLVALQLKSSLLGLREPELPLFTLSLLVLIQGTQKIGVCCRQRYTGQTAICWVFSQVSRCSIYWHNKPLASKGRPNCTPLPKSAWVKQPTRLSCLVVYLFMRILTFHNKKGMNFLLCVVRKYDLPRITSNSL